MNAEVSCICGARLSRGERHRRSCARWNAPDRPAAGVDARGRSRDPARGERPDGGDLIPGVLDVDLVPP